MLKIGIILGIYGYGILLFGLLGKLYFTPILVFTCILTCVSLIIFWKPILVFFHSLTQASANEKYILALLGTLAIINLVGALGPEFGFDALWYHLTIPKLYLESSSINFIPGNLFYYSAMPRLTEMLFTGALALVGEIGAKIIHFSFGVLCTFITYRLARLYLNRNWSLIVSLIFYSNLVVAWLSTTAYVDLARAFYENAALLCLLLFFKSKSRYHLVISGVLLGLAAATKLLVVGSLVVFIALIFLQKKNYVQKIIDGLFLLTIFISIAAPWFILAYKDTGNPIYPVFTHIGLSNFSWELLNPINFVKTTISMLLFAPDPLTPIYFIAIPLIALKTKLMKTHKYLFLYTLLSYLLWYATSQSGLTRFLTVLLPSLSLITAFAVREYNKNIQVAFLVLVFILSLVTIMYRLAANVRYLPVELGIETKQEFLLKNLNFQYGDFYDVNSEIKNIVGNDTVLIQGIHNLYYADFRFTLREWSRSYKYVLAKNHELVEGFTKDHIIYENKLTGVTLYKL